LFPFAARCGKCRQIAPFVDGLREKFGPSTSAKVTFARMDIDAPGLRELAEEQGVKVKLELGFF